MESIVTIEKIINNGMGLARPVDSKVIMVPGVLADEVVKISLAREFRGYIEANLEKILSASPARVEPACPLYHECGGCDLQHAVYAKQLEIKRDILKEALTRKGINLSAELPEPTLASPDQTGYRYRIRMRIDANGAIGFYRKKTHTVVPVANCLVATKKINAALSRLQTLPVLKKLSNTVKELELFHSPADDTVTLLFFADKKSSLSHQILDSLTDYPEIDQAAIKARGRVHSNGKLTPLSHYIPLSGKSGGRQFSRTWAANCFSQVNARQNEQLVQLVCSLAGDVRGLSVLDLYCGMGNFSIPLALLGAAVTGIERNAESIKWARYNAREAGVDCRFFSDDVAKSLQRMADAPQKTDIIILDPPRTGIGKAVHVLATLSARQILYVSCDPATLARDVEILCHQGYKLIQLYPVDMFPQTHHIESVALLKRN